MDGLIVRIYLEGTIEGPKQHISRQKYTAQLRDGDSITKLILHTNRNPVPCYKILKISAEILKIWESHEVPEWSDIRSWKRLSSKQKVASYISGLDEGFGVAFEYVD
jgi:hypothetical protein